MKSGILWEGPSPIDGAPLVAIACAESDNRKTGDMVQVYILRQDIGPGDAVLAGLDVSMCGSCPMRGDGFKGRACYVNVGQAPGGIFRAYKRGVYPHIDPCEVYGRKVRLGAYGDPAMVPVEVLASVAHYSIGHTGYTHQWRAPFAQGYKGFLMASVETIKAEATARKRGWGTFRVGLASELGEATMCRNERDGTTCADCLECDGTKHSIFIPAHGSGSKYTPADKKERRRMPLFEGIK